MDDIKSFFDVRIRVSRLRSGFSQGQGLALGDLMSSSPLLSLDSLDINDPNVQHYAIKHLIDEMNRLRLLKTITEESVQRELETNDMEMGLPEINRQILACKTAVDLLEDELAEKMKAGRYPEW